MSQPQMNCRKLVSLITEYLEGQLEPETRQRFEEHLSQCDGCTQYLGQIRRTVSELGRLREEDLDPAMKSSLLTAFRGWRETSA